MQARAAVLIAQREPLALETITIPEPGQGQVLVRLLCSGICGSQLGEIDGVKGPDRFLPHLLGHEGTGRVLRCGPGVRTVAPDDLVALHWRPGAGLEGLPARYDSPRGPINGGWVTTFNEAALISENRLTRLPPDFDPAWGALLGCAVTTGFGVVNNDARLRIGESILVWGAGGIGLNIVQAAALVSAWPIIAVDLFDNRLDLAASLGATHCFNARRDNIETAVRELLGPAGADVAVDNTGHPEVIATAYRLTAPHGRTVLVGVPLRGQETTLDTLPLHFEKTLTGSHGGDARPDRDIPRYVRLIQQGRLDLAPLLGRRYPLDQINQAIADMRSGAVAGRCLIQLA